MFVSLNLFKRNFKFYLSIQLPMGFIAEKRVLLLLDGLSPLRVTGMHKKLKYYVSF